MKADSQLKDEVLEDFFWEQEACPRVVLVSVKGPNYQYYFFVEAEHPEFLLAPTPDDPGPFRYAADLFYEARRKRQIVGKNGWSRAKQLANQLKQKSRSKYETILLVEVEHPTDRVFGLSKEGKRLPHVRW
jgi:hypothetical protein